MYAKRIAEIYADICEKNFDEAQLEVDRIRSSR